jgi:hypothetical protein
LGLSTAIGGDQDVPSNEVTPEDPMAVQKDVDLAQDTSPRPLASTDLNLDQVVPLSTAAEPTLSVATQNVDLAHDTSKTSPPPLPAMLAWWLKSAEPAWRTIDPACPGRSGAATATPATTTEEAVSVHTTASPARHHGVRRDRCRLTCTPPAHCEGASSLQNPPLQLMHGTRAPSLALGVVNVCDGAHAWWGTLVPLSRRQQTRAKGGAT